MAPYEALFGRKYRTSICWIEVGDRSFIGPEIVQVTTKKIQIIQQKFKTAQSRQKSYADQRTRDLEFEVGDHVFVKITPMKGNTRFGKKGKVSPCYLRDPSHVIDYHQIVLDDNVVYEEKLLRIIDRQVQELKNKTIPMVKVERREHHEAKPLGNKKKK
ncbi:uncharacterized protein LOC114298116 [Camellia sinensis]|uniref:uncharacterized protein LOC114298116 n=1 Tax=Camellia sinensis TaxID=4442 RepID=UPI001035A992|nr:uncharacterized protein LOC114298116 [Camellia sinensis]